MADVWMGTGETEKRNLLWELSWGRSDSQPTDCQELGEGRARWQMVFVLSHGTRGGAVYHLLKKVF